MTWWMWWLLAGTPWAILATVSKTTWLRFGYFSLANLFWVVAGPISLLFVGLAVYAGRKR